MTEETAEKSLVQPYYLDTREAPWQVSLNGEWRLAESPDVTEEPQKLCYDASVTVPSSIYWQLYECGRLPHPYMGQNSKQYHFVDERVWYLRRSFAAPRIPEGGKAFLAFDGAAYYTRFWLNGTLLGTHEGMFGGPQTDVTGLLRAEGENEIIAEILPFNRGKKEEYDAFNGKGENRAIVPWHIARDNRTGNGDMLVSGLWRGVRLLLLPAWHLGRPHLETLSLGDDRATLRLETEIVYPQLEELHPFWGMGGEGARFQYVYNEGLREEYLPEKGRLTLVLKEHGSGKTAFETAWDVDLLDADRSIRAKGMPESQYFEREFTFPSPRLWWPHDMGEPFLYDAELIFTVSGQEDRVAFSFGVRTIELVRTAGPRVRLRWEDFQFIVNGKRIFVKGVNMMPQDILYREDPAEMNWTLDLARGAGIHLLRMWSGGGVPESDDFYRLCDEKGLMVWQDWFIANTGSTVSWPQEVLEAQMAMNLFRIRNHPSLAVHCGGNEFYPYMRGNAANMFVMSRTLKALDPGRHLFNTTPEGGSAHIYTDMEPVWYRRLFRHLPFVAESGIHSLPSMKGMRTYLSEKECGQTVPEMTGEDFRKQFPELLNHFVEYVPSRVPRMLSRASQIGPLSGVSLSELVEDTQIAACEFYEIMVQSLREQQPVTAGVIPWVFRRSWMTVGIQLVDGHGEPLAPFYYLKHAYRNLEAHVALDEISVAPGEEIRLPLRVMNEYAADTDGITGRLTVYDPALRKAEEKVWKISDMDGKCESFRVPEEWSEHFFFVTLTLEKDQRVIDRQVWWPKCLSRLADEKARAEFRQSPKENFRFESGPWLRNQIRAAGGAKLEAKVEKAEFEGRRARVLLRLKNTGEAPAFPVTLGFASPAIRDLPQDNYFLLEPGEERLISAEGDCPAGIGPGEKYVVSSWNGGETEITVG